MSIIWALATNTIAQAFRLKAAATLIIVFILISVILPFTLEADSTQAGEIKVILTYSITVATALLTALTVLLSASLLNYEIQEKSIFLLAAKPVSRWQILCGKWLGVVLLNGWLLLIMGSVTVCMVWYFARLDTSRFKDYQIVRDQVLTSRRSIRPPAFKLNAFLKNFRKQLIAKGYKPKDIDNFKLKKAIKRQIERNSIRLAPGEVIVVKLSGIPLISPEERENKTYTIRYKVYATDNAKVPLHCEWITIRPSDRAYLSFLSNTRSGASREFQIPATVVDKDGSLWLQCRNLTFGRQYLQKGAADEPHAIAFSIAQGIEVLAPSGYFITNFLRALLLVLIRLAALTAIGIAASTLLHFPVAALLLLTVLAYGYGRDFSIKQINKALSKSEQESNIVILKKGTPQSAITSSSLSKFTQIFWYPLLKQIIKIPLRFADTDPVPDLVVGRKIGWGRLSLALFWDLLLRGGGAFMIGLFCFYRRELIAVE